MEKIQQPYSAIYEGEIQSTEHISVCSVPQASNVPSCVGVGIVHCMGKVSDASVVQQKGFEWGGGGRDGGASFLRVGTKHSQVIEEEKLIAVP